MASTPTPNEAATAKKSAPAKAAPKKAAPKRGGATSPAQSPAQSPGQIIAERYRDTAYEALVGKNGETVSAVMSAGEAALAGMAEVSQEMMTFAGDRPRQVAGGAVREAMLLRPARRRAVRRGDQQADRHVRAHPAVLLGTGARTHQGDAARPERRRRGGEIGCGGKALPARPN